MNSDQYLINSYIASNDTDAINQLLVKYQNFIFVNCLKHTNNIDEARDFMQEIMLKVYEKIDSYSHQSKFSTWLYAITRNYCYDQISKNLKQYKLNNELQVFLPKSEEIEIDQEESSLSIKNVLSILPKHDRDLITSKYLNKKTIKEMAIEMKLSESCIKMRLSRSMKKLRAYKFNWYNY